MLLAGSAMTASGEEFRVYTTVRSLAEAERPIVARSLTLFRGQRSYDWIEDAGELVVDDRSKRQATVLNRQLVAARLDRDQMTHLLRVGREEAESYLATLGPGEQAAATAIGFTLAPTFTTQGPSQGEGNRVIFRGGGWQYTVETFTPPEPGYVAAYLDSADQAAAVNFLIHPQATFPAMRQAVNAELRRLGVLPLAVELRGPGRVPLHLRAEHRYAWTLESFDLSQIARWDDLLSDRSETGRVRWTTLRDFQQQTLAAE